MSISEVFEIESLAAAAWPAEHVVSLGPWRLRATRGVTSRANSVFTSVEPGAPAGDPARLPPLLAAAETFYAERGLPAMFQITPATGPDDLDARLARRGYAVLTPSEVWTAGVADVLARTAGGDEAVALAPRPDTAWLECAYDEPPERRRVHAQIVGRIDRPAVFASLRVGGAAVACGLCVSGDGRAGVFSMVTGPGHRGRGLARRILHALAHWAAARGDRTLYLQVSADNAPARALYRGAGFAPAYPYHFRLRTARELRPPAPVQP